MLLTAIATFAVVLGIVFGAYWMLVLRPEQARERQLARRLAGAPPVVVHASAVVRPEQPRSLMQARLLTAIGAVSRPVELTIERAGLTLGAGRVLLGSTLIGLLTFTFIVALTQTILIAALCGAAVAAVPFLVIRYKAIRRIRQFEQYFPEAIDLIARALRAGHALTTGLGMVAEEMRPPVGAEFRLLYDRQNYGMPLPDALRSMAHRIPLVDVRFFVAAALTQRESGGNLAEVLDNMSAIMRERFVLKRHVRVVSAHGRVTGWVLGGLPVVLAGILALVAPAHMSLMWTDPLGQKMAMGALGLQVVGALIIRRIVNIDP